VTVRLCPLTGVVAQGAGEQPSLLALNVKLVKKFGPAEVHALPSVE
jgi:hypothetical protein